MAWISGQPQKEKLTNWNDEFRKLKGQLEEDIGKRTFGKFLMHNIGFTARILTGFILEPDQRIVIKGWLRSNFGLTVAGRGYSKSFIFAHFCYLYCLFNPNRHIIMVSATFRSSRKILENIDEWSKRKEGGLLRQAFEGDMVKRQDMYKIKFRNGSTIVALPLGDPEKLRSFRCNVLGIDEGLLIPDSTIELVLKPFLAGGADITKKQKIRQREDKLIASGKLKEEDRKKFYSAAKMIILSSASYQFEPLYKKYLTYLKRIENGEEIEEISGMKGGRYLVHQLSYEAIKNQDRIDAAIRDEITSGMIPESVIKREYKAQFIMESEGFFSAKKMEECTIPDGSTPCVEIRGERGAEYILAIDASVSSSAAADHFAMCVCKIVTRPDGKQVPLVVHQYATSGHTLNWHIQYLLYILIRFNIVYIINDSSGGDNLDFINICNESEIFKKSRMQLNSIGADFGKEDFQEIVRQVKRFYNKQGGVIVQKQYFHASFIRGANEYLKYAFDFKNIYFAGKAQANYAEMQKMIDMDIGDIHRTHPEFLDEKGFSSIDEFIVNQDVLIDLVKAECAMIQPSVTQLGHISYNLPSNLKRNKDSKRSRKDSYTALFMCNWACHIYLEMLSLPIEDDEEAIPTMMAFPQRH